MGNFNIPSQTCPLTGCLHLWTAPWRAPKSRMADVFSMLISSAVASRSSTCRIFSHCLQDHTVFRVRSDRRIYRMNEAYGGDLPASEGPTQLWAPPSYWPAK